MLFRLKSGADPFELNPGAKAVAEFAELTDKQFFFVCLVADVDLDNPLNPLGGKDRRTKAASIAGYGMEGNRPDKNARNLISGNVKSVEKAIAKHIELQPDRDKRALMAVRRQIEETQEFLEKDKEKSALGDAKLHAHLLKEASKLSQELPELLKVEKELVKSIKSKDTVNLGVETFTAADITEQDQKEMDDSDEPMSTIDIYMSKQNADNRHTE